MFHTKQPSKVPKPCAVAPGHISFTRPSRSGRPLPGCLLRDSHDLGFLFVITRSAYSTSEPTIRSPGERPVRRSQQPCTSGPELPASPPRRRGLWERLAWIRAWQRLGVQLWPAEAQASRLPAAHSWSARSPRREVGEGPRPSRPSSLLPCCLPGA